MSKRKNEENESSFANFYYNNKIIIWLLIAIILVVLVLKFGTKDKEPETPVKTDVQITIEPKDNVSVGIGNTITLKANINVTDAIIVWTSGDEKIAKVENGNVTGIDYGNVKIMATYIDSDGIKYTDTCNVAVIEGNKDVVLNNISFPEGDLYMPVNNTYQLNLILNPSNALISDKVFVSNNESVITVTRDGLVTSHKEGHAKIKTTINGQKEASIDVYVGKDYSKAEIIVSPTSISFGTDTRKIKVGASEKLNYSITPANANRGKLTWSSSESNIVSVDQNGQIKGVSEGEATISITSINGQRADIIIEVYNDIIPVEEIIVDTNEINMEAGKTQVITPVVRPSNASNQGLNYSSTDPSIVSVSVNGLGETATLSALKKGTVEIIINSGSIEKRIKVNVTGDENNSEIDEGGSNLPTTIKVTSNKNNLAKSYEEALKIPVPGATTVSIKLSVGVGKIKYCFGKYGNTLCTPGTEKYADATILIPSGDMYVLRVIKYDYKDKEITSTSPNYIDGVLNYYVNTQSDELVKLYTVEGAYGTATEAALSPSKIGNRVTITVNDSKRHLEVCSANGKTCTPSTRVNNNYSITLDSVGTTRIYVNEYDSNNKKIGNTEVYYAYVKE